MKRIKLMGLALIAVFALGAFAAASAFAEEPELKFQNGEVPSAIKAAEFTAEAPKEVVLESEEVEGKFISVKCAKAKGKGAFTSQDKGTIEIDFESCKNSEGQKCNSTGDSAGIILTLGEAQLVDILPSGTLDLGIYINPENKTGTGDLEFLCGGLVTVKILGNGLIGAIDNSAGTLLTVTEGSVGKLNEVKALWKQSKGKQEITECMTLKALCATGPFDLTADYGLGKGETLSGEAAEAAIKFKAEMKVAF